MSDRLEASSHPSEAVARPRFTPFDICILFNALALSAMIVYAYVSGDQEFALYGVAFLALLPVLWLWLRRANIPAFPLVLATVAVLLHFAGGFVQVGDDVLYGQQFLGFYVDKWVHVYNSVACAVVVGYIFRGAGLRLGSMEGFIVVMVTLAVGAVVEVLEFSAVVFVDVTGVGGYANNLGDLVADLLGAVIGFGLFRVVAGAPRAPVESE